jgi:hypothetical protein
MVDLGWSEGEWPVPGRVFGKWRRWSTHNIYGRSTSTASWQRIIELLFEAKGVKMTEPYPWAVPSTQAPR